MHTFARLAMLFVILPQLCACERSPTDDASRTPGAAATSAWVRDSVSTHVVLKTDAIAEFAASIEDAQESAGEARQQFLDSMPHEQLRFAVLWMAATTDGSREFVWVRPAVWSPFRIEGVLLSVPTSTLESGAAAGELVSFPIEELADWVILDANRPGHALKGATTLTAIEQRIGAPSPNAK